MRFGVLGTGIVGTTISSKLVELGHEVTMGARDASNPKAAEWASSAGERGRHGTFADAAASGEMLVNATGGRVSLEALGAAGEEAIGDKVLLDISNPLDFDHGFPPSLSVCNTDSVGEQIQRAFPRARVVKTLNTVNAGVMVNPGVIDGGHTIFVSGNDADAKSAVGEVLQAFGWRKDDILDLGDITTARGTEMYLALWVRMLGVIGRRPFNIRVVAG